MPAGIICILSRQEEFDTVQCRAVEPLGRDISGLNPAVSKGSGVPWARRTKPGWHRRPNCRGSAHYWELSPPTIARRMLGSPGTQYTIPCQPASLPDHLINETQRKAEICFTPVARGRLAHYGASLKRR